MEISRKWYVKSGSKWVLKHTHTSENIVYEMLCDDLIAKTVNKASYIGAIKRINNFDGTQTITVFHKFDDLRAKAEYTIKNS